MEVRQMKKIFVLLLTLSMFLGLSTSVFASDNGDKDYLEGIEIIEKANVKIDEEIEDAVKKANKLSAEYIEDIRGKKGTEIIKLNRERLQLTQAIESGLNNEKKLEKMKKEVVEINEKIAKLSREMRDDVRNAQQDIDAFVYFLENEDELTDEALIAAIEKLSAKLSAESDYRGATNKYIKDLNKVINECFDETLEMSNKAIAKAKEKGVIAECSWKLIRFGHKKVWIDPIRIIGRF